MALTINSAQYNSGAEYETVTGDIVTINNAKPYVRMKQVVCAINPVQAGSGDPSPTNVRPISGWSEAKVTRTGKNLLKDIAYQANPTIIMLGQTENYWNAQKTYLKAGTYIISFDSTVAGGGVYFGTSSVISNANIVAGKTSLVCNVEKDGYYSFWLYYSQGLTASNYSNFQLELGSTATDYEPYNGTSVTIDLDGTRYGSTLDVTRGKLTVTKYCYAFTGNETFIHNESAWGAYAYLFNTTVNLVSSIYDSRVMSSHFKRGNYGGWSGLVPNDFIIAGTTYIGLGYNGTANELKAYLSGQVTAGTPVQVIGTLATPIEVDVTSEAITTLLGTNNLWSDTGDIEVEYCADTKRYIQKLISQLA